MIPEFYGTTLGEEMSFLAALVNRIEAQSSIHISWYTHKNPAGCWICDLFQIIRRYEMLILPKSPLDNMNVSDVLDTTAIKSEEI